MLVCINQGATALAHLITDLKVLHLPPHLVETGTIIN